MNNINLELLIETYNRIVKLFKDYSNLNVILKEISNGDILGKSCAIYILYENDPYSKITFKKDLYNLKIDNIYSFLFNHNFSYSYTYIEYSIFKFAEACRQQDYINYAKLYNKVSYELYSSEAGKIIKELGFPTCLEELNIKMDLIGI